MRAFRPNQIDIQYIDAEILERDGVGVMEGADAILMPGGFGERGFEGKILAAGYARQHKIPYLGICYGMHAVVIDVARNCADLAEAHGTEITLIPPIQSLDSSLNGLMTAVALNNVMKTAILAARCVWVNRFVCWSGMPRRACLWPIYGARAPSSLRSEQPIPISW